MVEGFLLNFSFKDECHYIDADIQAVRSKVFRTTTAIAWTPPDWDAQLEQVVECCNMTTEDVEEDLRNVNIPKS